MKAESDSQFKIVLITTNISGGAGIACMRLHNNFLKAGVDSHILTLYSPNKDLRVHSLLKNKYHFFLYKLFRKVPILLFFRFYKEHLKAILKRGHYEIFSPPFSLFNLNKHPLIKDADIINLHWVSDLINFNNFFDDCTQRLIWTLHDLNPITGAFHYHNDLKRNSNFRYLDKHYKQIKHASINRNKNKVHFITLCDWMSREVLKEFPSFSSQYQKIPNALDIENFLPIGNKLLKEKISVQSKKRKIVFVSENINSQRKGFDILLEALSYLDLTQIDLIAVGTPPKKSISSLSIIYTGRITSPNEMAFIFSESDLFVIPSREDNLPNVIVEANIMGCPAVGFNIGGISEMIQDGVNGFKSYEMSGKSLSEAIEKSLFHPFDKETISKYARDKYSPKKQVSEYLAVIKKLIKKG